MHAFPFRLAGRYPVPQCFAGRAIMSLISFHRFLIAIAIVFCAGYAFWEFRGFLQHGSGRALLLALAFAAAAAGLGYYLRHLSRFLRIPSAKRDPPAYGP